MASAKPAGTTRRRSPRSPSKGDGERISPARWAGVALVMAAIVGAIVLAMISPSEPGAVAQTGAAAEASPIPVATAADGRLPTVQPRIVKPSAGTVAEFELPVTVEVPKEALPKGVLHLVVLRGEDIIGRTENPKTGQVVTVHAQLVPGDNELTVALEGPGGLGPLSEPRVMTLDRDAPQLAITSPKNKYRTYDDTARVTGTSEVGAEVHVMNQANNWDQTETVGRSGEWMVTVPLKIGGNQIVATSTDSVGLDREKRIRVTRLDGKPTIKIEVRPKRVKKSELPRSVKVTVTVTDAKGKPMPEARVEYTLGGPGRTTVSEPDTTNPKGKSTWSPRIEPSSSPADEVLLGVTVTSPYDGVKRGSFTIDLD